MNRGLVNKLPMNTLKEYFIPDFKKGILVWRKSPKRKPSFKGTIAGTTMTNGYKIVMIQRKAYLIHRVLFFMKHKTEPKYIDHIDGNPSNNSISNLRGATQPFNCGNAKLSKRNKSGFKGVSWSKKDGAWVCRVKNKSYGNFKNPVDAAKRYDQVAREKFGKFAKTNKQMELL